MKVLEAAKELQSFIQGINKRAIQEKTILPTAPNHLFLKSKNHPDEMEMREFSDNYIRQQIKTRQDVKSLVFTNLVHDKIQGKELSYFLYKGYHQLIESGLVYYQIVEKDTLEPIHKLEFSNVEQNIFFQLKAPDFEESSCNALEAKGSTATNKKIVFLIGNLNEERLLYDIERLIVTTTFNSIKHSSIHFHYIITINLFSGKVSDEFYGKLEAIKKEAKAFPESYPNLEFSFEYGD